MKRISFIALNAPVGAYGTLDLINSSRHSACSDPRDRVFALAGLLRADVAKGIAPNYLLSPEEVYTALILHYLRATSDLNVLRLCTTHNRSMPSWVPDLSVPRPGELFTGCWASVYSEDARYFSVDGSLVIRGVLSSTINYVSSAVPHGASLSEILATCRSWEPQNIDNGLYKDGGTVLDAFIYTLMAGFTTKYIPPGEVAPLNILGFRAFFHDWIPGGGFEDSSYAQRLCIAKLREQLPGRAFFTTCDGYMGLCPANAKPEDSICVILGCEAPLLLRRTADRGAFQLIGECYVHGLMHGELLLGPIPRSWKWRRMFIDSRTFVIWERDGVRTLEDPRAAALPPEWQMRYEDVDDDVSNYPFADDGSPRKPLFENKETGYQTYLDPRETLEYLMAMGVNIQDFILI